MNRLHGKIAVITGGSRGLGLALAQAYTQAGAQVMLASRSAASVEKAVQQIGSAARGMACDVADAQQIAALAERTVAEFGCFDIWVNNAGLSAPYGPSMHMPVEEFDRVLRTNILGTYYGSHAALHHFLGGGRPAGAPEPKLINMLGQGDRKPVPLQNAYASTKAWINTFTKALAKEYQAAPVGIFAYNPGLMETELVGQVQAVDGYQERLKLLEVVLRLWAVPPAVSAEKAVWLASSETDGRTGLTARQLTTGKMFGGVLGELSRRVRRQPAGGVKLKVEVVPATLPPLPEKRGE